MTNPEQAPAIDPHRSTRWWILGFLSLMLMGNYYVYDSVGPVADHLQRLLGFSDTQIGTLNAIYSVPNVFMVLIGGMLIDRFGAGVVALWTTGICLAGALLTAATGSFVMMAAGRLLFGLGAETMIVATTAAIGLWFLGRAVALAMALNLSLARGGSYLADISPAWASDLYEQGWQPPLWLATGFAALAFVGAVAYWWLDRRAGGIELQRASGGANVDRIVWADVLRFDRSYWYVVGLCVTFYSVIFPFRSTFAIKFFQHSRGMSLEAASVMNSYVFLAAVFATPLFGFLSDRFGRRAASMIAGSLLLPLTFLLLATTPVPLWVITVMVGISFSMVPAILWPSVAYVVEPRRLGTAFGLMTMVQNIGLAGANLFAGWLNDRGGASADNPAGYQPMLWFFFTLSTAAMLFAVALRRREVGPASHGLEQPAVMV